MAFSMAPSSPVASESRERLLSRLSEAAEVEHNLLCSYLYAAYSLKTAPDEGLSFAEADAVRRWYRTLLDVAIEEMTHLCLVANLAVAIGGAPRFERQNFPLPRGSLPADLIAELERRFHDLSRRRGLPPGVREFRAPWLDASSTRHERVDVAYPTHRVIVELDGRRYHSRLEEFENDRRRDQAAIACGWVTLRFTWSQVVREPDRVASLVLFGNTGSMLIIPLVLACVLH